MTVRTIPNREELHAARADELLPRLEVLWDRDREVTHLTGCGAVYDNVSVLDLRLDFGCESCNATLLPAEVHHVVRSLMAAREWLGDDLRDLVTHEQEVDRILRQRLWTEEDLVELGVAVRDGGRLQDETAEGLDLLPGLEELAQQVRERAAQLEETARTALVSDEAQEGLVESVAGIPAGPGLEDAELLLVADPNADPNVDLSTGGSAVPGANVVAAGRVTVDGGRSNRERAAATGYPYVALRGESEPAEVIAAAARLWEPYGRGALSHGDSLVRAARIVTGYGRG